MRRGGGERRVDHDAAAETHVSVSHGPGTGGTLAKLRRLIGCRLLAGRELTSGPSAKLGLAAAQQLAAELCTLSELGVTTSPGRGPPHDTLIQRESTALPAPASTLGHRGGGRQFFVRQKVPRQIIYVRVQNIRYKVNCLQLMAIQNIHTIQYITTTCVYLIIRNHLIDVQKP